MYDIFLSYKHTDDQGRITEDYYLAKQLYGVLTDVGYKVFFSEQSLADVGSARFKQEIDNALDSTKILIVVLANAEYASSKWVRYEWDSYYGDYLSGAREKPHLYTYCKNILINDLPRTLRSVQQFHADDDVDTLLKYMNAILPVSKQSRYQVKPNDKITFEDIADAVQLDHIVFPGMEHVDPQECWKWFTLNPDIYVFIKDTVTDRVVAYTNTSPITEECYDKIRSGEFLTTNITDDMILNFDMPYPYSLYFFSIVIHPSHQNTNLFFMLVNELVEKFIRLSAREVYIKRMIADAITSNGEKICKLFGMQKVTESAHDSTLYEIQMIPPNFKKISKKVKQLYDCYQSVYLESPYLFDEE